jgi:adenylate kinase family enzyme
VIRNRLNEYSEKTLPVLQFYKDKGVHHDVDATGSIDQVHAQIQQDRSLHAVRQQHVQDREAALCKLS